jgi:tetratricopeptide (TPR) repeat protein
VDARQQGGTAELGDSPSLGREWLAALALGIVTVIAYLPVWQAGFIWDDDTFLLNNPLIQRADGLRLFWFSTAAPDYFPATSTTLWIEWRLWGAHALGYHLVNVLLHTVSVVLLWRVLRALRLPGALLAAAIFAVHPVNVESVAWVTERKNTLAMVFYLLSVRFYLVFEERRNEGAPPATQRGIWIWYALAILAFMFGLLSKSAVAPLPVVLLGIVWWRRGRIGLRPLAETIPFFLLALAAGLVSIWFQYHRAIGASMAVVRHDSLAGRVAAAGWAVWFYLYKALVPWNLSFVYPRWQVDPARMLAYLPDLLLLASFVVCWLYRRSWGRPVLFALGYFVVMLLPVLGFLNIYFMRYSLVADHWQYFAIIGPIALAAAGLSWWTMRRGVWAAGLSGAGLVLLLAALSWRECGAYRDVETLWLRTLEKNPRATLALNNLGNLRLQQGRLDEAAACLDGALAVQPDAPDVLSNLGAVRLRQGRVEEAIRVLNRALALEPGSTEANNNLGTALLQAGRPEEAVPHFQRVAELQPQASAVRENLASALLRAGRASDAIAQLRLAVKFAPDSADAWSALGDALRQTRDPAGAAAAFEHAVRLQPGLLGARVGLGNARVQEGRIDDALVQFREAVRLAPGAAAAHFNLASALMAKGAVDEAVSQFETGLALDPRDAGAQNNLASALLRLGRPDDAIAHLRLALEAQPNLPEAQNNLANALLGKGRIAEAVTHYEAALAALPDNPFLLNNLAWVLATCPDASVRNGKKAVELARKAVSLPGGNSPALMGTLAAAYAETGDYDAAKRTAGEAIALAEAQKNAAQAATLRARLRGYEAGAPFRDGELAPR